MPASALSPHRALDIAAFLEQAGWEQADIAPFAADWSPRRYARLRRAPPHTNATKAATAILMDAAPDQKTPEFVALAGFLNNLELHSPQIYAARPDQGLVLMEDFGDRQLAAALNTPSHVTTTDLPTFIRATNILAKLHKNCPLSGGTAPLPPALPPGLPVFDSKLFIAQLSPYLDEYIPFVTGRETTAEERTLFCAIWQDLLRPIDRLPRSLLLRDFILENLMDLPNGEVGLLDFQDAGIGPVAYDLASLVEVVRRDGAFDLLPDIITSYCATSGTDLTQQTLLDACTLLSAQRHTRILGRLAAFARRRQADKAALIARVEGHVRRLLALPLLAPLRPAMEICYKGSADKKDEPSKDSTPV